MSSKKARFCLKIKRILVLNLQLPAAGEVIEINRGAKRVLQSVVIKVAGDEQVQFDTNDAASLASLEKDAIQSRLVESGLWTAFRTRPYSKIPAIDSVPTAIFVNAMDTNPLAADPAVIIAADKDAFENGLTVVAKMSGGKTWLSKAAGSDISAGASGVSTEEFAGPHPAGLVGTHIHFLDSAGANKMVWHVGYQDVIAIGKLFTDGQIDSSRVVALAGPAVNNPRLVRTVVGANTDELTAGQVSDGEVRVISGSVLHGPTCPWCACVSGALRQSGFCGHGRSREETVWLVNSWW